MIEPVRRIVETNHEAASITHELTTEGIHALLLQLLGSGLGFGNFDQSRNGGFFARFESPDGRLFREFKEV